MIARSAIKVSMNVKRNLTQTKLNITQTPAKPFEIVHLDTLTIENSKYLTIMIAFLNMRKHIKLILRHLLKL